MSPSVTLAWPGATAWAQDYPARPITLVVPYPTGTATDSLARLLAPKLSESTKQNVIVENRGGASTTLGTEHVARPAPAGYTILIQAPNIATNEFALKSLRWKRGDFAPVSLLVRGSNVLLAGPTAPVRDFKQLAAASKANRPPITTAHRAWARCLTWPSKFSSNAATSPSNTSPSPARGR